MRYPRSALSASIAASTAVGLLAPTGCTQYYRPPALPANQLAMVEVDSRASVLDVDGLPLPPRGGNAVAFSVAAGCRTLSVKYEESYFIWGGRKAKKAGLGGGLGPALANTEVHDYETLRPIRFFIPAKAGLKYWVTATFTGDEFLPRVVEIEPNGDAGKRLLPDEPCEKSAP